MAIACRLEVIAKEKGLYGADVYESDLSEIEAARAEIARLRREADAEVAALIEEIRRQEAEMDAEARRRRDSAANAMVQQLGKLHDTTGVTACLLTYVVSLERLDVILTDREGAQAFPLKAAGSGFRREELYRQVSALHEALKERGEGWEDLSRAMHDLLLPPALLARLGEAGCELLFLSRDHVLRYLPFGALHDGDRLLAERWPIVEMPLAARAGGAARDPKKTLAAFGASRGGEREHPIDRKRQEFTPLPHVPEELDAIAAFARQAGHQVETHADEAFTKASLHQALERDPATAHFATHFALDAGILDHSALLLGDGSTITLDELLYGLRSTDMAWSHCRPATRRSAAGPSPLAWRSRVWPRCSCPTAPGRFSPPYGR